MRLQVKTNACTWGLIDGSHRGTPAVVRWSPTEIKHPTTCTNAKSKQLFYWRCSFCKQWPTFHTYKKYSTGAYTQCEICLLSGLVNTQGQCAATFSRCTLERLHLGSNLYCTWRHTPGLDTVPAVSGKKCFSETVTLNHFVWIISEKHIKPWVWQTKACQKTCLLCFVNNSGSSSR